MIEEVSRRAARRATAGDREGAECGAKESSQGLSRDDELGDDLLRAPALERYPDTYNKQPLGYAGLAAQKSFNTLYLMGAYGDPKQRKRLEDAFRKSGKKMDMGKSCLHFRTADNLPLDAIGEIIASTPPERMIEMYEAGRPKKR